MFRQWVMSDSLRPYDSYGNGSAMCVSSIGWWFFETKDMFEEAAKTSGCTHNHPEGGKGACTVALAISLANRMRKAAGENKATLHLPTEMENVLSDFRRRIGARRKVYHEMEKCKVAFAEAKQHP